MALICASLFSLILFYDARLGASQDAPSPANDNCVDAVQLLIDGIPTPSTTVGGSTTGDFDISFEQCGGQTFDVGTAGVWFTVEGTGATLKASTCSESRNEFLVSHRITIYEGSDCGNSLICMDSRVEEDPDCPYPHSSHLEWRTNRGQPFFILVHDQTISESAGDFDMAVTDITQTPPNDECNDAIILKDNVPQEGTTLGATEKNITMECFEGTFPQTSRINPFVGVWYRIQGLDENNGSLSVFLCSETEDLGLAVFTGGACGDVTSDSCLETAHAANFNFECGPEAEFPTSVSWNATSREDYFVLVYGADNAIFGLTYARSIDEGGNSIGQPNNGSQGSTRTLPLLGILHVLCWMSSFLYRRL